MSPELIAAVKERLNIGHTNDSIKNELQTAGYPESVIDEVLKMAQTVNFSVPEYSSNDVTLNLPKASALFQDSFNFIKSRPDLCLALTAPLLVLVTLGYFLSNYLPATYLGLLSVIALVLYVIVLGVSLYIISENKNRTVSLGEAFFWVKKHIWGLVWVYVLTSLVTYGGFLLFIIPGIIVSFLVYLSQYVYVKEGISGLDALLRSRDLIRGNWWLVVGRLVKIGFMFLGVFMILGLVAGLFLSVIGENSASELVLTLIMQFISACAVLMGLHIGVDLYSNLVSVHPVGEFFQPAPDKWKYRVLVGLGVLTVILGLIAIMTLESLNVARDQAKNSINNNKQLDLEFGIDKPDSSVDMSAKERASELRSSLRQGEEMDAEVLEITPLE